MTINVVARSSLPVKPISNPHLVEERRKFVALPANENTSNRALGKKLGVSEGTIRGDRKYLKMPADLRARSKVNVPKAPKAPKAQGRYDPSNAKRHRKQMLAAAEKWLGEQALLLPDVEWVVDQAGRALYFDRDSIPDLSKPTKSPYELFPLLRPGDIVEDYMPPKLYFCKDWLARWLACCLPRQSETQDEMLKEILHMAQRKAAPWRS